MRRALFIMSYSPCHSHCSSVEGTLEMLCAEVLVAQATIWSRRGSFGKRFILLVGIGYFLIGGRAHDRLFGDARKSRRSSVGGGGEGGRAMAMTKASATAMLESSG